MALLRIREIAEEKGLNLGDFQRALGVSVTTARRLWNGTADGMTDGDPLKQLDLMLIDKVMKFLEIDDFNKIFVYGDDAVREEKEKRKIRRESWKDLQKQGRGRKKSRQSSEQDK